MYKICLLLILSSLAFSSTAEEVDSGSWATLSRNLPLNETLSANFMFQTRIDEDFAEIDRYLLRPSVSLKSDSGAVWTVGYDAHFIQSPSSRMEHRTWQQFGLTHDHNAVAFSYRIRVEERFIEGIDEVAIRPRFLIGLKYPLPTPGWYLKTSEEIFINLNEVSPAIQTGYDQSRFFVGLGRPLIDGVNMELGYQLQHINGAGADFLNHFLMVGFSF
ncbi:MAG: DUF2490 domain-containing protein [Verrucomicrobiales bacterium]|nr:DUF2490 domain-containing protein [Verrucomicrobiales bacterium]